MQEELIAGRELDAIIAEKVMGWSWYVGQRIRGQFRYIAPKEGIDGGNTYWAANRGYRPEDQALSMDNRHNTYPLPRFSTDIEAAWDLIPRMNLGVSVSRPNLKEWMVAWRDHDGTPRAVRANTAPMAICLAAPATVNDQP